MSQSNLTQVQYKHDAEERQSVETNNEEYNCSVTSKESPYYDTWIINYFVDVHAGMCEIDVSADDITKKCRTYRFPITKIYNREALTRLLYAASEQFNSDYVSEDHVYNLVTNAIDSIWYGMRKHGIRKLRPKEKEVLAAV